MQSAFTPTVLLYRHNVYIMYVRHKGEENYMATLEELIWEGIAKTNEYAGIHAGHFDYPCTRYSYFKITEPELFAHASRGEKLRFWIGEAIHDKRILPVDKNFPPDAKIEYAGCFFTPDEYYDGILLEKKTVEYFAKLPKNLRIPAKHHILRCEHYRMVLEMRGFEVKVIGLLYIDSLSHARFLFTTEDGTLKLRSTEETKKTFDILNEDLKSSVGNKILPPRHMSWLCSYCKAFTKCFTESGRE